MSVVVAHPPLHACSRGEARAVHPSRCSSGRRRSSVMCVGPRSNGSCCCGLLLLLLLLAQRLDQTTLAFSTTTTTTIRVVRRHSSGRWSGPRVFGARRDPRDNDDPTEQSPNNNNNNKNNIFDFFLNPYPTQIPLELRDEIFAAEANTPAAQDRQKPITGYILICFLGVLCASVVKNILTP